MISWKRIAKGVIIAVSLSIMMFIVAIMAARYVIFTMPQPQQHQEEKVPNVSENKVFVAEVITSQPTEKQQESKEETGWKHGKFDEEVACLAQNMYYEARGEPQAGQVAVALVTINRVKDPEFPKSICDVVWERGQFSWTQGKTKGSVRVKNELYDDIHKLAEDILNRYTLDNFYDFTDGSIYFHSGKGNSFKSKRWILTIGEHKFYKERI